MSKYLKQGFIRKLEWKHSRGEISYSKMIELIEQECIKNIIKSFALSNSKKTMTTEQIKSQKKIEGNALYTLLAAVKLAYRQTKSDLNYIKNKSNFWKGKTYMWGRTHLSVAWHNFYWNVIKVNTMNKNHETDESVQQQEGMTPVEYLADRYNYITWLLNRDEISRATADEWREKFLKQAKEMEDKQLSGNFG